MKRKRKILLKCDVFGAGTAISGGLQAAGNVGAAMITADASNYAADQAYQGALATNQANIDIANKNNATLLQNQRETNAANLQLAQQQNQWNLEQWNRQNEYNSPANQMKLYREAGLNPVLAQGNFSPAQELMSADLANQQAVGSLQQPNLINPAAESSQIKLQGAVASSNAIKDIAVNAVTTAKSIAEIKKVRAESNQIETLTPKQAALATAQFENLTKQTDWIDKLSESELQKNIHQAEVLRNTIPLLESQAEKERSIAALNRIDEAYRDKLNDLLLKKSDQELKVLISQESLNYSNAAAARASARASNASASISEWEYRNGQRLPNPKSVQDKVIMWLFNYFTDGGTKDPVTVIKEKLSPSVVNRIGSIMSDFNDYKSSSDSYRPPYSPTAPVP